MYLDISVLTAAYCTFHFCCCGNVLEHFCIMPVWRSTVNPVIPVTFKCYIQLFGFPWCHTCFCGASIFVSHRYTTWVEKLEGRYWTWVSFCWLTSNCVSHELFDGVQLNSLTKSTSLCKIGWHGDDRLFPVSPSVTRSVGCCSCADVTEHPAVWKAELKPPWAIVVLARHQKRLLSCASRSKACVYWLKSLNLKPKVSFSHCDIPCSGMNILSINVYKLDCFSFKFNNFNICIQTMALCCPGKEICLPEPYAFAETNEFLYPTNIFDWQAMTLVLNTMILCYKWITNCAHE